MGRRSIRKSAPAEGVELNFSLHPGQEQVFTCQKRFWLVAAGRRWGKTYLSSIKLIYEALKNENEFGYDLKNTAVYYVAPTFQQAKDILWTQLKDMARPITAQTWENTGVIELVNGRHIHLKGSDRPDTLRGIGLSYVVMDEYADMKPETWEAIIRPTLSDVKGGAMFIGTPKGKNHFYELYNKNFGSDEWGVFTFSSTDNPYLDPQEIITAARDMPIEYVKQEFEANFSSFGGTVFQGEWFVEDETEPKEGQIYIAVDPAGYVDLGTGKVKTAEDRRLDETAIAIVKTGKYGWYVLDILTGRWGIRETALQIILACKKHKPAGVGIEKGALMNAIMPYLTDNMRRYNVYPKVLPVTHGNKNKTDRIVWALQGRLQQDRLKFAPGQYFSKLVDQAIDFPSRTTHNDMLDALAYVDQLSKICYMDQEDLVQDTWEPVDEVLGF